MNTQQKPRIYGIQKEHDQRKKSAYLLLAIILCVSFFASSSYRAITHDEGLVFAERAVRLLNNQSIFDENSPNQTKNPARILYTAFIAASYKLLGINLTAAHLFPYLLQILNPGLFFLLASHFYSTWVGAIGALFFTFLPFNFVCLNTQHNHAVFMFLLLMLIGIMEFSLKQPKWCAAAGIIAALLILTRFTDGVIFVFLIYAHYLMTQRKTGFLGRVFLGNVLSLVVTYSAFALWFDFPILYSIYYIPHLFERQAEYTSLFSWEAATKSAVRSIVNWYLFGKFLAPCLAGLVGIGLFFQIQRRHFLPLLLWAPHLLFMMLIFGARYDLANLEPLSFSTIGFLLLSLEGGQRVFAYCRQRASGLWQHVIIWGILIFVTAGLARSTRSLVTLMEDAKPASTMWNITTNSPLLPGNPDYEPAYISLDAVERVPVPLREQLIQSVRGEYRSWYKHRIGAYAFEHGFPEQAGMAADFVYADTFRTNERWEKDASQRQGRLWNKDMPGHLGAFPHGASGSFVYEFHFSEQIAEMTVSDIHTQWERGDRIKMWTSIDGEQWNLQYDNKDVHYTEDRFYHFFTTEFYGRQTVFIKYDFKAGDKNRDAADNSGASLHQFSLAVSLKKFNESGKL
ncbi:MAG: glycosyltransferase family 39 protein [bacterium]|nr:glycosyltransferase family 39 protein [bacterium]